MNARVAIPPDTQHRVLDRSRRRCALCIHFNNDWGQKEGQVAHLDRNPSNFAEGNLAFLCLPHHDDYDTKRRQTKNLTIREAKTARDRLYKFIEAGGDLAMAGQPNLGSPKHVLPPPAQVPHIRTVKDAFLSDYKTLLSSSTTRTVTIELPDGQKQTVSMIMRVYYDFEARAKFIAIYVPSTIWLKKICYAIANSAVHSMNAQDDAVLVSGSRARELMTSSKELMFSSRIYIYNESLILKSEYNELLPYFTQKKLDVVFRDLTYARDTA
jgi:hypothetical protein